MTALEAMASADAAWRERRPRVKKLAQPVIYKGQPPQAWEYSIPLQYGSLVGWRVTQEEALYRCLALLNEMKLKGWT